MQQLGATSLYLVPSRAPGPAGVEGGTTDAEAQPAGEATRSQAGLELAAAELAPAEDAEDAQLAARWSDVETRIRGCRLCRLCESRTQAVPGSGTRHTRLFVIGEGPGEKEDLRGEAFVGRAGELLTKILKAIDFARDQVFITNVVKCRPPGNRAPLPDEVAACNPFLDEQLDLVRPVAILTLGASATRTLLGTPIPISRLRGRVHLFRGIPLVPTYHPAALLRNPEYKRPTWEDVQLLRRVYDEGMAGRRPDLVPSSPA